MEEKLLCEITASLVKKLIEKPNYTTTSECQDAYRRMFDTVLECYRQEMQVKQELGLYGDFPPLSAEMEEFPFGLAQGEAAAEDE